MSTPNKDIEKVEVRVKWDPSPHGAAANDLDIIAATYPAGEPYGAPAYLVHFDSRSPDGTITLNRDSRNGQGFGFDEVMTIELNRLADAYGRVVVGVAIQQRDGHKTFGDIGNTAMEIREGYTSLTESDFSDVAWATAAVVGEFTREGSGLWGFRAAVRGFDGDPDTFAAVMGSRAAEG
ncbi:TerD family protein [Streptomyces anulatus]|uniref:TerD family protein n=1 Tax=Streptomyces TaxID=1883 RepID=UPI002781CF99|nr:TerD family protein [Streptomyces sp. W4I9-2]MDQ0695333.1 stress response protein SCP2 [Streptomyces sp. W4I9-2]